jgi:hypothetical protein
VLESLVLPLLTQIQVNFIVLQKNIFYVTRLIIAFRDLRLIYTYHAVPLPCRAAKGLVCVFLI